MRVSSASLAGSLGGGIAVPILSRLIARAVCGDISLPSKRLACSSQLLSWVRKRSLDLAAISLLSSVMRSEEHTSELQSLMRISYAVFCLKKKKLPVRHSVMQRLDR